jgi:hypothetical protein
VIAGAAGRPAGNSIAGWRHSSRPVPIHSCKRKATESSFPPTAASLLLQQQLMILLLVLRRVVERVARNI